MLNLKIGDPFEVITQDYIKKSNAQTRNYIFSKLKQLEFSSKLITRQKLDAENYKFI